MFIPLRGWWLQCHPEGEPEWLAWGALHWPGLEQQAAAVPHDYGGTCKIV